MAGGRVATRDHQRRRRGRELDLHDRPARRRRHADRREDRRRRRRGGCATSPRCKALGDRVNARTRSMGVALTSCTVPAAGKPTFDARRGRDGDGRRHPRRARPPPRASCSRPTPSPTRWSRAIAGDLGAAAGGDALLLVNGFGGTPSMELYLMYDARAAHAREARLRGRPLAGRQLRAPRSTWPAARSR